MIIYLAFICELDFFGCRECIADELLGVALKVCVCLNQSLLESKCPHIYELAREKPLFISKEE